MMTRLRTACPQPGCPAITDGGRCPRHQRPRPLDNRPSPTRRGYGVEWRRIRLLVLREEPFCRECGRPSKLVDHIDGNVRNMARVNLQGMCWACHNRKTAKENGGGWTKRG